MDLSKRKGPVETLSPSRITDFYNSSKTQTRATSRRHKTKDPPLPSASVYMTPESSPGSDLNLECAKESDDIPASRNVDANHDYRNSDSCSTDITDVTSNCIPGECDPTSVMSASSQPYNQNPEPCETESVLACEGGEAINDTPSPPVLESAESTKAKSRADKGKTSSAVDTLASTDNCLTESPSLPRPKLLKGTKSKSKTDGLIIADAERSKPGRRKKKAPGPVQKSVITDFFPVRRSGRQTTSAIEKEKHHQLEELVLSKCEDGLQVTEFESKGRGVVATKEFSKGDFVVEYAGELIDVAFARQREKDYGANPAIGCYMYFFSIGTRQYCVDATAESGRLGRLINHSRNGNCCTKAVMVKGNPHLILVASRDIRSGEELSYDYGDRSKAALEAHPWLKS